MSIGYERLALKSQKNNDETTTRYLENTFRILCEELNYDELFKCLDNDYNDNYWIMLILKNLFDPNMPNKYKEQFINKLINNGVKIIKYDPKTLIIECEGRTSTIKNLYLNEDEFNKSDYNEYVNYFDKNIYIPILINKIKKLSDNSKIVIGYVKGELLDNKQLLAWIEVIKNNKTYVIDFTSNMIIDKNSFYSFYKPEILNEIKKENLISDKLLSVLINDLSIQYDEYLIFDREFKREIEKKKELFL